LTKHPLVRAQLEARVAEEGRGFGEVLIAHDEFGVLQ
jgi:hypothetical protein